jgi:hemoglobin
MATYPLEQISKVVISFYQTATQDILIGYLFRDLDFNTHIPHIINFWDKVLNKESPIHPGMLKSFIGKHERLNLKRAQIDRWVLLFVNNLEKLETSEQLKKTWLAKIDQLKTSL